MARNIWTKIHGPRTLPSMVNQMRLVMPERWITGVTSVLTHLDFYWQMTNAVHATFGGNSHWLLDKLAKLANYVRGFFCATKEYVIVNSLWIFDVLYVIHICISIFTDKNFITRIPGLILSSENIQSPTGIVSQLDK